MKKPRGSDDQFDEKEAQERFEAALRSALKTPHKPLKAKKVAKKKKVRKTPPKRG